MNLLLAGSLLNWPQWPEVSLSEAGNQEFLLGLQGGCRGPRPLTFALLLLSQVISREMDQKWRSEGLSSVPVWDAGIPNIDLFVCKTG